MQAKYHDASISYVSYCQDLIFFWTTDTQTDRQGKKFILGAWNDICCIINVPYSHNYTHKVQLILRLHDSPDFLRIFSAFPDFLLEHMTSQLFCYLIGWYIYFSNHWWGSRRSVSHMHSLTVHSCVIYWNFCHTKTYSQWLEQQWCDSAQWWLMSCSNLSEYWKF